MQLSYLGLKYFSNKESYNCKLASNMTHTRLCFFLLAPHHKQQITRKIDMLTLKYSIWFFGNEVFEWKTTSASNCRSEGWLEGSDSICW